MQTQSFCWHQGHFYIAGGDLTRWKPSASHGHCLVAKDVGTVERVAISPQGEVYLIMRRNAFPSFRYELWVYDSHETLEQDQPTTVVETDAGSLLVACVFFPVVPFGGLWYSIFFIVHPIFDGETIHQIVFHRADARYFSGPQPSMRIVDQ